MKASLKEWHRRHLQNLNGKIMEIKNRISVLDDKGEIEALHEEEIEELLIYPFNYIPRLGCRLVLIGKSRE